MARLSTVKVGAWLVCRYPARVTSVERPQRPAYGEGRSALLAAVIRVVAREGLRGLTYRAVAKEANVTHGLVTHHFGARDVMIEEALAFVAGESLGPSSLEPGTGRITDYARDLGRQVSDNPEAPAFEYELLLEASRRKELEGQVRGLWKTYIDAAQRELERIGFDRDPALARLLFAAVDGLVLQQLMTGKSGATNAAVDRLHEMLEALLQARGVSQPTESVDGLASSTARGMRER